MANTIKTSKNLPSDWSKIWIRTLKQKKGTFRKLDNYRGIFLVPILSIIFEKLLKKKISDTLQQNISKFQNGGMKGKGVVDNLFILRGVINRANYLGKNLWLTFYDMEKCFDSLWLEDCINSLWDLDAKDDILCLSHLMNIKATVTIKTPLGGTDPLFLSNCVKQGTVFGPVLNNCSLNKLSTDSIGYNFGSVQIKSMEFVDDLADPNRDKQSALASNTVLQAIQHEKRLAFSAEKCELLKINSKDDTCLKVNGKSMKQVDVACYLGDHFNRQGNNSDLCEERVTKAKGTIIEICSLCKGIDMENKQIESMLLLCNWTDFIPRLIYNCEAWSNLTPQDYLTLRTSQLIYLRNVLEVSKATPIAAMYLELGILPVRCEIEMTLRTSQLIYLRNVLEVSKATPCEIEMRQLLFLKHLLDKKHADPCLRTYIEMLKFENETNWANNVLGLRRDYNLPLNDDDIKKMSVSHWKNFVKSAIFKEALLQLQVELS